MAKYAQSRIDHDQENEKLTKLERSARINVLLLQAAKLKYELKAAEEDIPPLVDLLDDMLI